VHEYEVKKFPRAHNTGAVSHRPSDKAGIIVLGRYFTITGILHTATLYQRVSIIFGCMVS